MREFADTDGGKGVVCNGHTGEIMSLRPSERSKVTKITADVIRGKKVTTIPKCRFDATVCGAVYINEPVVRDGNLICARGKKDISPWMKEFVQMIEDHLSKLKVKSYE